MLCPWKGESDRQRLCCPSAVWLVIVVDRCSVVVMGVLVVLFVIWLSYINGNTYYHGTRVLSRVFLEVYYPWSGVLSQVRGILSMVRCIITG